MAARHRIAGLAITVLQLLRTHVRFEFYRLWHSASLYRRTWYELLGDRSSPVFVAHVRDEPRRHPLPASRRVEPLLCETPGDLGVRVALGVQGEDLLDQNLVVSEVARPEYGRARRCT